MDDALPKWFGEFWDKFDLDEKALHEYYNRASSNYEELLEAAGYHAPMMTSKAFDFHAKQFYGDKAKQQCILDIGAGTGLVGRILKGLGYQIIHAIDCTKKMLDEAKKENIYTKNIIAFIDEKKNPDIKDGEYDAMVSCGAFSSPQIQPRAFDEMLRWLKKGGMFCFTVRSLDYEKLGYKAKFDQLEEETKWKLVAKEEIDYIKKTESAVAKKAFVFVYERL